MKTSCERRVLTENLPALGGLLPAAAPVPGSGPPLRGTPAVSAAESLHPALWRAHQLGRQQGRTWASGFDQLDAVLPGGGWPAGVLTELLLPHAGVGEMRLLAPALGAVQRQAQRSLMFFDPPALPFGEALAACGLEVRQLIVVRSREALRGRASGGLPAADVLWALEQSLKSGQVGAVLAWLPALLPGDALRRLQLAAQGHDGPAFLLRDDGLRSRPSPAPLRLWLHAAAPDVLRVHLLKRRGPPLGRPLTLRLPPVLSAPAGGRAPRAAAATGAAPVAAMRHKAPVASGSTPARG